MNSPTPEAAPLLSADECLLHKGALAYPGRLALSDCMLSFTPSRTLDRLAGASDLDIEVDQITELSAGGINHNLDIYVGETLHRFSGRGAIRVHNRLLALIAEDDETPPDVAVFRPGERVLLQGQGELFVNELIGVRGEITFTDYRLRFAPGLGLEQLIWNTTSLDAPLESVQGWALKGMRRRLHLTIDGEQIIVGGPLAPRLYNMLETLLGDAENTVTADEIIVATWDVNLRRGPVAHVGQLEFTPTHVNFKPTGLIDALVGVKPFDFAISDVTRISVRGWPEKKLIIRAGHQVFAFTMADINERFDDIKALVRDRNYHLALRCRGDAEPRYQVTLDSWTSRVEYQLGEQIVFSSFAMDTFSDSEVRFGWLLLLRTRVLFLPLGGPASQEKCVQVPVEEICRLDGGPRSRRDQVLFSCNQGRLRYLISDREGGVEDFWSQCRTPTRILAWETLGPRSTARVMGKCRFIRIMSHGETVVDLSPGMTVEHDAGVAIVLPGEPGTSVPIDTWVTVEIGQSEGIYQVDSKVVRATITPLEGVVPNPKNTHLLIVSYPPSLRVYNQRESYRVGTEFELRANRLAQTADGGSWMATGESFPCNVVDISMGGCAIETTHEIEQGDRVSVSLPLLDQWVEIRGTCVRTAALHTAEGTRRYGLEFRELSMAQEDILHKAVMTLQRESMADDEDSEEGQEESAK